MHMVGSEILSATTTISLILSKHQSGVPGLFLKWSFNKSLPRPFSLSRLGIDGMLGDSGNPFTLMRSPNTCIPSFNGVQWSALIDLSVYGSGDCTSPVSVWGVRRYGALLWCGEGGVLVIIRWGARASIVLPIALMGSTTGGKR